MRISSDFSIPVIFIIRMLIPRHIRSGLRQSQHLSSPRTHGVFTPMLRALSGPATFRALWIADSKSGQTLFLPAIMYSRLCPYSVEAVRLPTLSILTTSPVSLIAFAPQTYASVTVHRAAQKRRHQLSSARRLPGRQA